MSDTEDGSNKTQELDWSTVESDTQSLASSTKVFIADLPSGIARFEYEMVDKGTLESIAQEYTRVNHTGRGKPDINEVEITDSDALNAEIVCEGVVDAPDGFPMSPTKLSNSNKVVKEMLSELADSIEEYSTMDEEVRQKFR